MCELFANHFFEVCSNRFRSVCEARSKCAKCFRSVFEMFGSVFMKNCNVILALLFGYMVAGLSEEKFVDQDNICRRAQSLRRYINILLIHGLNSINYFDSNFLTLHSHYFLFMS